jgi:tetratricopeptide (TPR) repeat protein
MRAVLIFLMVFTCVVVMAQTQPSKTDPKQKAQPQQSAEQKPAAMPPMVEHFLRKYATAVRWNDYEIAKSALYDLIVQNPGNDSLIYTLAYHYYDNQQFASSLLICQDLLNRQPKNLYYLEMAATAAETMGAMERSLQYYESLYLLTNNVTTLYRIANIQYTLKRFGESATNADILLTKPEADTIKLIFNDAQGEQKEYAMKVAIMNLKGMIALDQNDKPAAKKHFTDALTIAPDFVLAKQNLEKTK